MKNLLFVTLFFLSFTSYSQDLAFNAVYVKAEENAQDNIAELFDNFYGDKEFKSGGVALERLWLGRPDGMTHRVVFLWELGKQGLAEGQASEFEESAFWGWLVNRIEKWGTSYAGRFINWIEGDIEKNPYVQIWDIKPENPQAFQKAQLEFVESLPDVFKDRFVGFGTYDINRPNGATHWALVSGADLDDHLSFVNNLQKNHTKKFMKYMEDRGKVELVHNFTFENLRFIR